VLRLGSPEENPDLDVEAVAEAVRGVAESSEGPLTAPVESQGPLGDDGAQVAFLGKEGPQALLDELLAAPVLREGVGAVQQYPEFTPHVTLSYEGEDAAVGGDPAEVPAEVIFDRLGLWDGEEHTEFPLGPSASTEENVEFEDEPDADDLMDELAVAMMRPVDDPLVVNNAGTLARACLQADALTHPVAQAATRRVLVRRARALGCQHMIPRDWLRAATNSSNVGASPVSSLTSTGTASRI